MSFFPQRKGTNTGVRTAVLHARAPVETSIVGRIFGSEEFADMTHVRLQFRLFGSAPAEPKAFHFVVKNFVVRACCFQFTKLSRSFARGVFIIRISFRPPNAPGRGISPVHQSSSKATRAIRRRRAKRRDVPPARKDERLDRVEDWWLFE